MIFFIRNAIYLYFCTLASADTHASTHLNTFLLLKTYNFCDVLYPISYVQLLRICKCKEARRDVLPSFVYFGCSNFKPFQKKLSSFFRVNNEVYTVFRKLDFIQYLPFTIWPFLQDMPCMYLVLTKAA